MLCLLDSCLPPVTVPGATMARNVNQLRDRLTASYLTNPDIVYPVRNAPPRFTLGSFGLCLGAMYQRLTKLRPLLCGPMSIHYCGKPFPMVFDLSLIHI